MNKALKIAITITVLGAISVVRDDINAALGVKFASSVSTTAVHVHNLLLMFSGMVAAVLLMWLFREKE